MKTPKHPPGIDRLYKSGKGPMIERKIKEAEEARQKALRSPDHSELVLVHINERTSVLVPKAKAETIKASFEKKYCESSF